MIGNISSYLTTGGNYALQGVELGLNSRIAWLAIGTLTSWNWGWMRAKAIQDSTLQIDCEVRHTPQDCLNQDCARRGGVDLREHGRLVDQYDGIAFSCEGNECSTGAHFVNVDGSGAFRHWQYIKHKRAEWKPISLLQKCQPTSIDFAFGGACLALILFEASGWGRSSIHNNMLSYVAAHTMTKFLDALVVSSFVIAKIHPDTAQRARSQSLSYIPTLEKYDRAAISELMIALVYFGLRLSDGWLVAKMPARTLPFVSLGRHLLG